jgi:D-alanine-D-alanine ligase
MPDRFKEKRIGVLMGGVSAEREISLRTGSGVLSALRRLDYFASGLDWTEREKVEDLLASSGAEVVWNALHGTMGEDGWVQRRLEAMRIPYTGSGVQASEIAMDKVRSKEIFRERDIPTPDWKVVSGQSTVDDEGFGYPVVVKPSREGSTVGITIVQEAGAIAAAVAEADRHHGDTMVERFIAGAEITVAVLGGKALGSVEIRPRSGFYDYKAKYLSGDTEYLVPAPLPGPVADLVAQLALRAHEALGCSGYSRTDMRVDAEGKPWVLEVNTLPGLTETSLFPKIARHAGMDYDTLVARILETAALKG